MRYTLLLLIIIAISCKPNNNTTSRNTHTTLRQLPAAEIKYYHDSVAYFMDTLLNNQGFSGGILVAKNGTVLYEHYQGFSDVAQQKLINDSTPFHVASTSKTFTSTAIMQLAQQGKLKLTDTLQKFFPKFPYTYITINHLLTHMSGLANYAYFITEKSWNTNRIATNDDVLAFMTNTPPALNREIGERFNYCNTNFVLLALIVEKISGQPFPQYVKEKIFDVAGMKHSFVLNKNDTAKFLPSFKKSMVAYPLDFLDGIYGDKNVYTTCQDLLKYHNAITNHLLLDTASYKLAWQPQQLDRHYYDSTEYYGLGWRLKVWPNSNKIAYHNGWWHGNNAIFQHAYQDTATVIVTGNVFNQRIYHAPVVLNYFRPYYAQMNFKTDSTETDAPFLKKGNNKTRKRKN
jgi:CubicO group peptidase (beta-lactamase class C family)